ncbi:MAG: hypothetical protein ACYTFK_12985 [Planctomycetota bacterium]|jgi:hypothetical protein
MAKAKYPVKRGSRWDRLSLNVVKDWTIDGMNIIEKIETPIDSTIDPEFLNRSPDYIMGHISPEAIEMYCRIVVYSAENGTGERAELQNMEGEKFTIPQPNGSPTNIALGYYKWLKMDEAEQLEIDERIIELNKPPASRHILPAEQLSEQEKSDPNSKGEGKKTKKG